MTLAGIDGRHSRLPIEFVADSTAGGSRNAASPGVRHEFER